MSGSNSSRAGWNRRDFLKGSAAVMAAAYGLRPDWAMADIPMQFDGSKFKLAAPEPNPKSGGVLRYGITMRPPHFDVHQSGTINSLASQAVQFHDGAELTSADIKATFDRISKPPQGVSIPRSVLFKSVAEITAPDKY